MCRSIIHEARQNDKFSSSYCDAKLESFVSPDLEQPISQTEQCDIGTLNWKFIALAKFSNNLHVQTTVIILVLVRRPSSGSTTLDT